jgi:hypothetical protein
MTDIIVPGQPQTPTYPQVGASPTPQGILFTINLGPTIAITHLISYEDIEGIAQMARSARREMKEMQDMAERAVRGEAMTDLAFTGQKIVSGDIETQNGNITATTGNIAATAGSITAGTTVTATTNVSAGRHYLATGSAPTAAVGAQAGSSPPAPVVTTGSNDARGNITFGTGGSSAAGAHVAVTFATAYDAAPMVMVIARNTATEALGLYVSTKATTGFTLSTTGDSADSQANTVYSFDYAVIG